MTTAQSPPGHIDPETFFFRPDIYPLEFERGHVNLVPMTREGYARSLFTDRGRIVAAQPQGWQVPTGQLLSELEQRSVRQQPVFVIFHIAHCGSTLLSRALDLAGRTLVIREPFALRQLALDAATSGMPSDPGTWKRCLRMIAVLLGRRFTDEEQVIVKANVPVNFILDPLLALDAVSGGLALYTGFEDYLLSVLKTPMHRRWVLNVCGQVAGAIRATAGLHDLDTAGLDPPRAAACLWLAQMSRLRSAVAAHERLRGLEFRALLERPVEVLQAAMQLAGTTLSAQEAEIIVASDLFRRHAKDPGREFDRNARDRELSVLHERLGPEVDTARSWIIGTGAWDGRALPIMPALL